MSRGDRRRVFDWPRPDSTAGTTAPASRCSVLRDLHVPIWLYILGFATALGASLALTYAVRERARRARLFDGTDSRKIHQGEIPRLGGVAVFAAAMVALGGVLAIDSRVGSLSGGRGLVAILLGAVGIHFVGLYDDLRSMRARNKLALQVAIAFAVYFAGARVTTLSLPFFGIVPLAPGIGLLFTVVWLVGITNAFNLIDGLDGLASGAAMFALTTMFVAATLNGQGSAALVIVTLAGATLGFLAYNFHPASIFLGDSGSMFLGFMLAGVGLLSSQKSPTVVAVAIPVVSLGLPVMDTALAIFRRFLRRQPIFSADRGHIHHRLLVLGHTPRQATLLLYGACAVLGLSAMLLVNDSGYVALVLVVMGLGAAFAIQRLRYQEFQELARVLRKGVQQRAVIERGVKIREASLQLAGLSSLDEMFTVLGRTFASDECQRAEIRLRPSFLYDGQVESLDRRLDDDVPVWTWTRSELAEPSLWEIKLPLLDKLDQRVGSLVLWQDGLSSDTSLSHMHTIARELRSAIQGKIIACWHEGEPYVERTAHASSSTFERVIPLPTVKETHRRHEDLTGDHEVTPGERPASGMRSGLR